MYVKEDPVGFISFLMILLFIFLAVFADFIAPYGINETQYMKPKAAPSMEHIFGTDELSRDIFQQNFICIKNLSIYWICTNNNQFDHWNIFGE